MPASPPSAMLLLLPLALLLLRAVTVSAAAAVCVCVGKQWVTGDWRLVMVVVAVAVRVCGTVLAMLSKGKKNPDGLGGAMPPGPSLSFLLLPLRRRVCCCFGRQRRGLGDGRWVMMMMAVVVVVIVAVHMYREFSKCLVTIEK